MGTTVVPSRVRWRPGPATGKPRIICSACLTELLASTYALLQEWEHWELNKVDASHYSTTGGVLWQGMILGGLQARVFQHPRP